MTTKEEWLNNFKAEHGREPTIEEFSAAKAQQFSTQERDDHHTNDIAQQWAQQFEQENGRRPSMQEFSAAKQNEFQKTTSQAAEKQSATIVSRPTPPMSKGKKVTFIVVAIAVIAIIAGYLIGNHYYSRSSSMQRAVKTLKSYDTSEYAQQMVWSDTHKRVTKSDLQPMVQYLSSEKMSDATLRSWISTGTDGLTLQNNGHKFLIFPNYQLTAKPVNIHLITNHKDINIGLNGKKLLTTDSDGYTTTLKHQIPGEYNFTATGSINGGSVKTSNTNFIGGSQEKNVDLSITFISFTIESNLEGGDVYVGNNKIGIIENGKANVNHVAVSKGANVYVQKQVGSDTLRTKSTPLTDVNDDDYLTLDAEGLLTQTDADSLISDMSSLMNSYASNESDPSDADTVFTGGVQNKGYQDFKKMIQHNLHDSKRNADSISFSDTSVQKVEPTGKSAANVVFHIKYDFYYSSDTDDDNDTYGDMYQTFELIAHTVYNKSKDKWQIDSIDPNQKKISEDDNVN